MKGLKKLLAVGLAIVMEAIMVPVFYVSNVGAVEMVGGTGSKSSVDYIFGQEYTGILDAWIGSEDHQYFNVSLNQNSHVYIVLKSGTSRMNIDVYDTNGAMISDGNTNCLSSWNDAHTVNTRTHSCNLNAGKYYIEVYPTDYMVDNAEYSFVATAEPIVSLDAPIITSVSSSSAGAANISYTTVANALGYETQFSISDTFSSYKTMTSPSASVAETGLSMGIYYYVRTRAYTTYSDGLKIYSNWSRPQSVYVKKATNIIEILTASKKLKYSKLKKKKVSFIVVVSDSANATLKFSILSVPKKAKKYISINKSSGTITVKKGLKKGTYKVGVKITASATSRYKKASARKTIKIIVR